MIPKKKFVMTPMMLRYLLTFAIRISVFIAVFVFYLSNKELMKYMMTQPVWRGVSAIHVLWFGFMLIMIRHIFPTEKLSMAIRKSKEPISTEPKRYSEMELYRFVQDQNKKAWKVMLVWLFLNGVIGFFYLLRVFDNADLLMITVFFFLCDYICIMVFCPFQTFIMENRCCVNCRIYDWGHFMMFTPMLFIRNFFSWSLFFTSCVVLIHWEIIYASHPERFWYGANEKIQCANCRDKICQIKKPVTAKIVGLKKTPILKRK